MNLDLILAVYSTLMAAVIAIASTVYIVRKKQNATPLIFAWIRPIMIYFLISCLFRGGGLCNWIAWTQIIFLTVEAVVIVVLAVAPDKKQSDELSALQSAFSSPL